MYVDLKYKTQKAMPGGCKLVGWIELDGGLSLPLAWNAHKGVYVGVVKPATAYPLPDQDKIVAAIAAEYDAASRDTYRTVLTERKEESKYISCKINRWAAEVLRNYGHGNLAEGIRAAANLVTGKGAA